MYTESMEFISKRRYPIVYSDMRLQYVGRTVVVLVFSSEFAGVEKVGGYNTPCYLSSKLPEVNIRWQH